MPDDLPKISQVIADRPDVPLGLRIVLGVVSSAASSWVLTHYSLQGSDFEALGLSSETVKASITGTLTGLFVAPESIPLAFAAGIIGIRRAFRTIWKAITNPLPDDR